MAEHGAPTFPDDAAGFVVVPHSPGPVIRPDLASRRGRDDLDQLIDELFPDTTEGPGAFDAALLVIGAGLLGWALVGDGPTVALVIGVIAAGLGCILPGRSVWRSVTNRRQARRSKAILGQGVPMHVSGSATARLVRAYDELSSVAMVSDLGEGGHAIAAAHSALLESATLLRGRAADSDAERDYVDQRAAAIEQLTSALRARLPSPTSDDQLATPSSSHSPEALIQARAEVDEIGGFSSLTRLDELTAEARARRGTD